MTNTEKLLKMKHEIDAAQKEMQQLTWEQDNLLKQFETFGCKTAEEVKVKLDEMKAKVEKANTFIAEEITKLEGAYPWKTL